MLVVGMGYLILERIINIDHLPKNGEIGKIISISEYPSGSAANVIANLSKLDIKTGFIGKIGSDAEGSLLIEDMMYHSVDTKNITLSEGKSGVSTKIIDKNGKCVELENLGVNTQIRLEDIKEINGPDIFYSTTLHEKSFETQKMLLKNLNETRICLSLKKYEERYKDIVSYADIILLNSPSWTDETKKFYESVFKKNLDNEKKVIIKIKDCILGCAFWDGNKWVLIKNKNMNIVDKSGISDAFDSGFLFGIIRKEGIERCCKIGNLFAGECAKTFGPRNWSPKDALRGALKEF